MRITGAFLLAVAVGAGEGCQGSPAAERTRQIVRLVRDTNVGNVGEPLAREYAASLPDIDVKLVDAVGSVGAVQAIQRGEADLGFAQADVAYFAYVQQLDHPDASLRQLRGIAALQITPLHLIARSGLPIRSVADLRDRRVRTGFSNTTAQERLAELVLRAYDLELEDLDREPFRSSEIADQLGRRTVDAAFTTAYYPAAVVATALRHGATLVPIEGPAVERLVEEYPFMRRVSIPAHTYPGQREPVWTVGVERVLVCSSDLDDRLVHDLTQRFLEALPKLSSSLKTSLRLMTPHQASAAPIPLHKGAAQYYRERELKR